MHAARPEQLIGVLGTHTEVGKTWTTVRLLQRLQANGITAVARKPAQSFEDNAGATDAEQLAAAGGETRDAVCPLHRNYALPMAPPMAADALGKSRIAMDDLVAELRWPRDARLGLVETVGGPHSPLAHDGDSIDLLRRLHPDACILIADAGLGALNAVRLCMSALGDFTTLIYLNRHDDSDQLHRLNLQWLMRRETSPVYTDIDGLAAALISRCSR